jgi:hypothetical protein
MVSLEVRPLKLHAQLFGVSAVSPVSEDGQDIAFIPHLIDRTECQFDGDLISPSMNGRQLERRVRRDQITGPRFLETGYTCPVAVLELVGHKRMKRDV